jgi:hypothetical protein
MKSYPYSRVSWKVVVLCAGASLLTVPTVFADDPAGPRDALDDATVFTPPYGPCHSWGYDTWGAADEAHDCSEASGAIGAYTAAWVGGATSEATQYISLYTGRSKVLTVEAKIAHMGAAGSIGAGWGGTYKTWHVGSFSDDHKEALDHWISWEIVTLKVVGVACLAAPLAHATETEAAIEAIHLMVEFTELRDALADLKDSGDANTIYITFSLATEANQSSDIWLGLRASAAGALFGSAYALAFGQVESITVHGIAPPGKPAVDGPSMGYVNTPYTFWATSTDANDDDVYYEFDWGDSSASSESETVYSGLSASAEHTFTSPGTYTILVRTWDTDMMASDWKVLEFPVYNPPVYNLSADDVWISSTANDTDRSDEVFGPVGGDTVYLHFQYYWGATDNTACPAHESRILLDGNQKCIVPVSTLAANTSKVIYCSTTWTAVAGNHTLRGEADYNDAVTEGNEADNAVQHPLAVIPHDPPANDVCGYATQIGDGTFSGATSYATNDGTATCGLSAAGPDVWFAYTATCTGWLKAKTPTSDYDTVLSVRRGCSVSANELDCNDDCGWSTCSTNCSCVTVPVLQGTTYIIRVSGFNGNVGEFGLDTECDALSSPNVQTRGSDHFGAASVWVWGYWYADEREKCQVAFRFRKSGDTNWLYTPWQQTYSYAGDFYETLTHLQPATTYEYQAGVKNRAAEVWGDTRTLSPPRGPDLRTGPSFISVSCTQGNDIPTQTLDVWNYGDGDMDFYLLTPSSNYWLSCMPTHGSDDGSGPPMEIDVRFDTSELYPWTYHSVIYIYGYVYDEASGINVYAQPVEVPVQVIVNEPPRPDICLTPQQLLPGVYDQGITVGENAPQQTFNLSNCGTWGMNYTISEDCTWLSVSPTSGGTLSPGDSDDITVTYDAGGLGLDWHSCPIWVHVDGANPPDRYVDVELFVHGVYHKYDPGAGSSMPDYPGGSGRPRGDDLHTDLSGHILVGGSGLSFVMTSFSVDWSNFGGGKSPVTATVRFYANDPNNMLPSPPGTPPPFLSEYSFIEGGPGGHHTEVSVPFIIMPPDLWMTVQFNSPDAVLMIAEEWPPPGGCAAAVGCSDNTYLDPVDWTLHGFGPPPANPPGNFKLGVKGFPLLVDEPPVANAGGPYSGMVGDQITFDASSSTDPDDAIVGYMWDWNYDGIWDTDWLPQSVSYHTYVNEFHGQVGLQVLDERGQTSSAVATADVDISEPVNLPPQADAGGPYATEIGRTLTFDASSSTDPDGQIVGYMWDWEDDGAWDTDWLTVPAIQHIYGARYEGQVRVQIIDNRGATATAAAAVTITNDPYIPQGITVMGSCSQNQIGACCDPETLLCVDYVSPAYCLAPHLFFPGLTCNQLPPPCGTYEMGACCYPSGECWDGMPSTLCSPPGEFHAGQSCSQLPPPCGQGGQPCQFVITMWDSWGDGWNGGYVDVYVSGGLVLPNATLPGGAGPQSMSFPGQMNDVINTVWVSGEKPYECYYCITSESGDLLGCDNRPANETPHADAGGPYSGFAGQVITFDASNSHDPDGIIAVFRWDWRDDGEWDTEWLTGPTTTYAYDTEYAGQLRLQVVDNGGVASIAVATVNIAANAAPLARAGGPYTICGDGPLDLGASASTDSDGTIVAYRWDWTSDGEWDTGWLTVPTARHTYPAGFQGKVGLEVQDNHGARGIAYAAIAPGVLGDVNGDGTVNGLDVDGFVRAKLGGTPLPGENQACADYGGTLDQDIAAFVADQMGL